MQLPIGAESDFRGVIDLVEMKALVWPLDDDTEGAKFETVDIPAELAEEAEAARLELLESSRQVDEHLMEKYVSDEAISGDEIRHAIRVGTLEREFVAVLCGSAFKNKGVQPMLDAVVDYLPSPTRRPADDGHRPEGRRARSSASRARTSRSRRWRSRS